MNKKSIIIFGIVLLIMAIFAGGMFWYNATKSVGQVMNNDGQELVQKNNEELIKVFKEDDSEANSEKIDISNWKTYRNDYYGYQISYPEDWDVYERDYDKDKVTFKKIILDFLSKFMIVNPDYPRPTLRSINFYMAKNCDIDQLREHNKKCLNYVSIAANNVTGSPCGIKAENGKIPTTALSAFNNIFTLKEGEIRETLQYKKDDFSSSGFVFDNVARGTYKFINDDDIIDDITPRDGSCYSIEIRDSTSERRYLKIEKAILESLSVFKKNK